MKNEKNQLSDITLVGLAVRTNNRNEMDSEIAKIATLASKYWGNQIANNILHRANPGVTYSVYTEYDSDENGDYTYFIGEAVNSIEGQDLDQFKTITIPASNYQKFTTEPGKIPEVVISAWQEIWSMKEGDLGGKRKYIADFEIYDERAADIDNSVVDIYIGIED